MLINYTRTTFSFHSVFFLLTVIRLFSLAAVYTFTPSTQKACAESICVGTIGIIHCTHKIFNMWKPSSRVNCHRGDSTHLSDVPVKVRLMLSCGGRQRNTPCILEWFIGWPYCCSSAPRQVQHFFPDMRTICAPLFATDLLSCLDKDWCPV